MRRVETANRRLRAGIGSVGLLGVAGGLTCTTTMLALVIGIAGAGAAASMGGMGAPAPGGVLGVLTEYGPGILLVSVLLVTASLPGVEHPPRCLPSVPVCCCTGDVRPVQLSRDVSVPGAGLHRVDHHLPLHPYHHNTRARCPC